MSNDSCTTSTRWWLRPDSLSFDLVRRQQPRVDELPQDVLRHRPIPEGRQHLLAAGDGAGALGGDEVAEDLADDVLPFGADAVDGGLGMLGEGALYPGHPPVSLAGQDLSLPVATFP